MLKGKVNLTLMIGPMVPLPVSHEVMDALTEISVTNGTDGPSGFQLTFNISNNSPLQTLFLLSGGASPLPIVRVLIVVTVNGMPEVLIDGMMTEHRLSPGTQPGQSTLNVMGSDLTAAMDCINFSGLPFPGMPAEAQVAVCLAKYMAFGVVPVIIPSPLMDVPIPIQRIPRQQGTDFNHIKMLADEIGYTFYITPGPIPGTSTAYWGPEVKIGLPQSALNTNMGPFDNVEKLDFAYNSDKAAMPIVFIHNQETKVPIPIPIPSINPLSPPLGLVPPIPKHFPILLGTGKYSAIRAVMNGLAMASRSGDVVEATGSLDVTRYGKVLKSRGLVGVRGAGLAFDGMYYVKEVTHLIKRGEYKQNFKLTRNALVSNTPKVLP